MVLLCALTVHLRAVWASVPCERPYICCMHACVPPHCAKAKTSAEAREDDGWIARRSSPHDVLELLHLHDRVC